MRLVCLYDKGGKARFARRCCKHIPRRQIIHVAEPDGGVAAAIFL